MIEKEILPESRSEGILLFKKGIGGERRYSLNPHKKALIEAIIKKYYPMLV
jgi:hypothetical protein